jgi:hypothetical protein
VQKRLRAKPRQKVKAHRERPREQGLRPVQIWVPDVRSKRFLRLAHLDSVAIARSRRESDDQAFVDSVSVWPNR